MPLVKASPNQYLLTGRAGRLENRGSAVQAYLWPGTVFVLVPSTKQEADFAFTQETRDGIPLRFKGIVIYRITDPIAAAQRFDFTPAGKGTVMISELLTHVVLGELRDTVSQMTMADCIEQRKTTLSGVVETALAATINPENGPSDWGIDIEVAQLAQVFIVDAELRGQLEAEIRNEIKLRSDTSGIHAAEESHLARMTSEERLAEQKLSADREALRRAQELTASQMAAEEARIAVETPVRLLKAAREREIAAAELASYRVQNQVRELEVERDLFLPRAQQELRREILPIEQAPQIVESAARIFQGANLSIYGEGAQLVGQLAPVLEVLARAVREGTPVAVEAPSEAGA
jgi:SPFH domain / Band 7 family